MTRTRSRSWSFGPQWKQLGVAKTIGDGHEVAYELSNILFAYQQSGGPDGEAVYVETAWQPHLMVRPLDPHALLGDGALLRSNKGRVFVLDSSIPCADQFVKRGYLKVNVNEVSPTRQIVYTWKRATAVMMQDVSSVTLFHCIAGLF